MGRFRVATAAVAGLAGAGLVASLLVSAPVAMGEDYPPSPSPTATASPSGSPSASASASSSVSGRPTTTPVPTETPLSAPPPPGAAIVTVGGQEVQNTYSEDRSGGKVTVTGGDVQVVVDPKAPDGSNLPVDATGTLIVNSGGDIASSGRGFAPRTPVNFYLFQGSTPIYLGTLNVFSDGTFAGAVPIPADLEPGIYTLQVNGLTESDSFRTTRAARALVERVISISILVKVTPPAADEPKNERKAVRTIVYFDVFSAELLPSARRQLDGLVKRLPRKRNNLVRVVGFVGPGGSAAHIAALSAARAASVSKYLRSKGVRGTFELKIGGNAKINAPSARRADVQVFPNKAR